MMIGLAAEFASSDAGSTAGTGNSGNNTGEALHCEGLGSLGGVRQLQA